MSKTTNTIIAVALLSFFPALTIYTGLNAPTIVFSEEQAILITTQYLKSSPTFSYDGIEESIELVNVDTIRMPNTWSVTLSFDSTHSGYGDRTGEILLQVITPHTMTIMVSNGEVLSAVTDETYDEIAEGMLFKDTTVEEAEELALEWLRAAPTYSFDGIEESMIVTETLIAESYPVQYFVIINFSCTQAGYGDRTGQMLAQVITEHSARIVVSNGEVRSAIIDDIWDEYMQMDSETSGILSPEEAVDIVITYLNENYSEAEDLEMNPEWRVSNLTPEGLLGASTIEYSGNGWTITEHYAVVWKPTYSFEVTNDTGFSWMGSVEQSGSVIEFTE